VGKTEWASTAKDVAIAACETGVGSGLLTLAHKPGVMAVVPATFMDLRSICYDTYAPFQKKQARALDSLTAMTKSFVKDHVLANFPPRNQKEAIRRQAGVPVGLDYSDIADTVRTLLTKLLSINAHIIVTALAKTEKDDNGAVVSIGPDLPGQLGTGAPAMFDSVLYLKTRKILKDRNDPKSLVVERYFVTGSDGIHNAKDRNSAGGKSFLDPEEIFVPPDPKTGFEGRGTFPQLYAKILAGHKAATEIGPTKGQS
jgi:AAA domain